MSELDDQIQNRREKRQRLAEAGISPYPHRFEWDLEPCGVCRAYNDKTAEELEAAGIRLRVPGRVRSIRRQGKLAFADIHDGKTKLQLFIRRDDLTETGRLVLENLDLGDIVGATGTLMRTRAGELSLKVDDLALLSKALRPMPEKWHGLADIETRYRQRYLDLATNEESRTVFEVRAALVKGIREFLDAKGFLEVETPMMQVIPGGATARPFKTHHNALDLELYLRIAPELFLKRLLVGGIPRVYEINRNFRNEGISTRHNPEFTMLEFYWAYADYQDMMDLTEELITVLAEVARRIQGRDQLTWEGRPVDFSQPWQRMSMREAITQLGGVPAERLETAESVRAVLEEKGLPIPPGGTYGHLLMGLFEQTVEEHLFDPIFITDHPDGRLAARQAAAGRSPVHGAVRAVHRWHGDGQRLLRAERSGRAGGAFPPAGGGPGDGRRRGPSLRCRLRARPGARHAASRGHRDRDRPAHHASDGPAVHPRRDPVPADAARGGGERLGT